MKHFLDISGEIIGNVPQIFCQTATFFIKYADFLWAIIVGLKFNALKFLMFDYLHWQQRITVILLLEYFISNLVLEIIWFHRFLASSKSRKFSGVGLKNSLFIHIPPFRYDYAIYYSSIPCSWNSSRRYVSRKSPRHIKKAYSENRFGKILIFVCNGDFILRVYHSSFCRQVIAICSLCYVSSACILCWWHICMLNKNMHILNTHAFMVQNTFHSAVSQGKILPYVGMTIDEWEEGYWNFWTLKSRNNTHFLVHNK